MAATTTTTTMIFVFSIFSNNLLGTTAFTPALGHESLAGGDGGGDGLALSSFKLKITGDPTNAMAAWNNSIPFCRWPGVTCSGNIAGGRVTALELPSLGLAGTISPSLANLSRLEILHLAGNDLHGEIPPDLGSLSVLQTLNLSGNNLQGPIPSNICAYTDLRHLDAKGNKLSGEIPPEIGLCRRLVTLVFYINNLTGNIPPSLGDLADLAVLDLTQNNITGEIPAALGNLTRLAGLYFESNSLHGDVPHSLWNLSSLMALELSLNHFTGTLPPDLGNLLPNLLSFIALDNQFHGGIPVTLPNASSLQYVEIGENHLTGEIPPRFGSLRRLKSFSLGFNDLGGGGGGSGDDDLGFLSELTNCTDLVFLEFGSNRLRGKLLPLVGNLSAGLYYLEMGTNEIYGSIPPEIGNLVGLNYLVLYNNILAGTIPASIGRLRSLRLLSMGVNLLSGEIPSAFGNLSEVISMLLGINRLNGSIPAGIGSCRSLNNLDFSFNELTGAVPGQVLAVPSLSTFLSLSNNALTGPLPSQVGNLASLSTFLVSNNRLSGRIPGAIGDCIQLEVLRMQNNSFEGQIPPELAKLKGLQKLDLSSNNLSGSIPAFLGTLNLSYLNLSFNNLSGEVPGNGIFANISAVSIEGNPGLCGSNRMLNLPPCQSSIAGKGRRSHGVLVILLVAIVVVVVFLCAALLLYLTQHYRRRRNGNPTGQGVIVLGGRDINDGLIRISYADLSKATHGFSSENLIGVGSFGSVYKGEMELPQEGTGVKEVAVKVINLHHRGASQSFAAECEALRNARHRNLIKVLTACSSTDLYGNDFKALVFEFLPNGNLDEWLHPRACRGGGEMRRKLSLAERVNIALDIANAVDYLHHRHGPAPIVHCDLKPSNVLLDDDMMAYVGDFGLARVLQDAGAGDPPLPLRNPSSCSFNLKGSMGYVAPEYGTGNQVTTLGDVYSYGILLLELITGRSPTDDIFGDGMDLREYVETALPDRAMHVLVDPDICRWSPLPTAKAADKFCVNSDSSNKKNNGKNYDCCQQEEEDAVKSCVVSLLGIGVRCAAELPTQRMWIADVVRQLKSIKDKYLETPHSQEGFHRNMLDRNKIQR